MGYVYKLSGRVDSSNAGNVEKDIFAEYEKEGELSIDAGELCYISSAGLRVLLKLCQKQKHVEVMNVSPEVYDILEVTGFTDLLDVKKKLREVSVENCALIGKGGKRKRVPYLGG
jgi:anti-anti-sigma factor